MKNGFRVIDSDLHVLEPREVFEQYFDPASAIALHALWAARTTNRNWWMVGDHRTALGDG